MKCNADRLIEALIAAQMMEYQREEQQKQKAAQAQNENGPPMPPVVTISRNFGSLGRDVAHLLADTLELRCCDRSILHEVARRAHVDESLVKMLDEHVNAVRGHWWSGLLQGTTFDHDDYYRYLVKVIISIARTGGVILGRGANIILGKEKAFRVRITGCLGQCAARVAARENMEPEAARAGPRNQPQSCKKALEVDRERAEYIRRLYGAEVDDTCMYDLVLNSDRYDRVQMVELILIAMQKAGYPLADDVFSSLRKLA